MCSDGATALTEIKSASLGGPALSYSPQDRRGIHARNTLDAPNLRP
jgi:hypothetical protein